MKRHLQCAEQQDSLSNVTKYCACHEKGFASLILVTYETSFTMRGATGLILQCHQIVHLPRKMTFMSDVRHIWNVIYNRRSNKHHPPTSPNIAPATQSSTPKSETNLRKTVEASFTMADDSTMTRPWAEPKLVISHRPVRRAYFSRFGDAFCIENYYISRSGYLPKFHQILRLPRKVTLQHHQILRLPRTVTWCELLLDLLLDWAVTLLNYYLTELLLYWTVTLLSCYFTWLLLYWAVTLLNCYSTELLLLLLYWTVTLLSCYFTDSLHF